MVNDPPARGSAPAGPAGGRRAADWPAPRRRPATYPGPAPRYPYLLVDDRVHPLRVERRGDGVRVTTADGTPVDDVLRRLGAAPLADRVATVAYGANRSPDSLALKFVHHGPGAAHRSEAPPAPSRSRGPTWPDPVTAAAPAASRSGQDRFDPGTGAAPAASRSGGSAPSDPVTGAAPGPSRSGGPAPLDPRTGTGGPPAAAGVAPVVPVLMATLVDVDAVGAGLTSQGFVYADIVDSPGTRLEALLPLLDHRQLAAIHDSEAVGGAYDCAWLPDVELAGTGSGTTVGAMAYVGRPPVFCDPAHGEPLAFAAVPAEGRRYSAFDQLGLLARVVHATGTAVALAQLLGVDPGSPPEVIAGELVRLVNGQWWYRHHSGDRPSSASIEARRLLNKAMAASPWPRSPSSPLTRSVLTSTEAYDPPPSLHLGTQLRLT